VNLFSLTHSSRKSGICLHESSRKSLRGEVAKYASVRTHYMSLGYLVMYLPTVRVMLFIFIFLLKFVKIGREGGKKRWNSDVLDLGATLETSVNYFPSTAIVHVWRNFVGSSIGKHVRDPLEMYRKTVENLLNFCKQLLCFRGRAVFGELLILLLAPARFITRCQD
jgi:hypothetical protein